MIKNTEDLYEGLLQQKEVKNIRAVSDSMEFFDENKICSMLK